MEKFSNESFKYYKIENDKKNELEKHLGNSKSKVQSENINYLGKRKILVNFKKFICNIR